MRTEYLRLIPGLRSNAREIYYLRERADALKEQRSRLQAQLGKSSGEPKPKAEAGASRSRAERIEWFSDQVPFSVVDRSIHISLQHRFLFVETPKVGCSSIKKTLIRNELGEPEWEADSDALLHLRKLSPLLQPSQLANIKSLCQSGVLRRFVFVRNPYSRILSAYLQMIQNPYPARSRLLANAGLETLDTEGVIEFSNFLEATSNTDIPTMDAHWRPQYHQCFFDQIDFDFIGRFENFDADLASCVAPFGAENSIGRHAPHSTSASEKLAEFYTKETLALVNTICGVDFEKLGYQMLESLPENPSEISQLLPAR